jgi:hypothetical protein
MTTKPLLWKICKEIVTHKEKDKVMYPSLRVWVRVNLTRTKHKQMRRGKESNIINSVSKETYKMKKYKLVTLPV